MLKRILDSVHGNIFIDTIYFENIIDTDLFQRLRRVEQSSIRSIFPCARHDRFVHSIGVFYLGSMINKQIRNDQKQHNNNWYNLSPESKSKAEQLYKQISQSYLIACLLHDIAHAPFSHTFESYYGDKESLRNILKIELGTGYDNDIIKTDDINYHEYASAFVAITKFGPAIKKMHANPELIARMITGVKFTDTKSRYNQIANGFIVLLHGDVIDADRLDYACRDVWASGYATSTVDALRLISGIHFKMNNKCYEICFTNNVLNEIASVIAVKDFQMNHVIHHHTVEYEQYLLKNAAEQMALKYFPNVPNGEEALKKIISIDAVVGQISLPPCKMLNIKHITDDDLIYLIKNDNSNEYYGEWASRKYKKFALWKTRTEFFSYFSDFFNWNDDITEESIRPVVESVIANHNYDILKDLCIVKVKFKDKVKMDDLNVTIGKNVLKYDQLFRGSFLHSPSSSSKNKPLETIFCYVYLSKNKNNKYRSKSFVEEKENLIKELRYAFKQWRDNPPQSADIKAAYSTTLDDFIQSIDWNDLDINEQKSLFEVIESSEPIIRGIFQIQRVGDSDNMILSCANTDKRLFLIAKTKKHLKHWLEYRLTNGEDGLSYLDWKQQIEKED